MSITNAMFSGSSALKSMEDSLQIISNNLANSNTTSFKSSRSSFQDTLTSTIGSSAAQGANQVGSGVDIASVDQNFEQGGFESTNSAIDMAISGRGFFVVKDTSGTGDQQNTYYTRAGDFKLDVTNESDTGGYAKELVNNAGLVVQGYPLDSTTEERSSTALTDIDFAPTEYSQSSAVSTTVDLAVNLNATATAPTAAFSATDATSYNYSTTARVFDEQGGGHNVQMFFQKTGENAWSVYTDKTGTKADGTTTTATTDPIATLTFTPKGQLGTITNAEGVTSTITNVDATTGEETSASTAAETTLKLDLETGTRTISQSLTFDLGSGIGTNSSQQLAADSTTLNVSQDGYPVGFLDNLKVDEEGKIFGVYTNGQVKGLYQVGIADFNNTGGLSQQSSNVYAETRESGAATYGVPKDGGNGEILSQTLEQSNVSISDEFIRMITTQRSFQANSRIVSTSDGMLEELISLKR